MFRRMVCLCCIVRIGIMMAWSRISYFISWSDTTTSAVGSEYFSRIMFTNVQVTKSAGADSIPI